MLLWVLVLVSASARADTMTVPGDFDTIQAAANAAEAGDVIVLAAASYTEGVTLKADNITIQGAGPDSTTLVGGILTGANDNIVIENMTIQGGYPFTGQVGGIAVTAGTSGHTFQNLTLSGGGHATDQYRGIHFGFNVANVLVSDVTSDGWRSGMYINPGSSDIEIVRYSGGTGGGIVVDGQAGDLTISDSAFSGAGVSVSDYDAPDSNPGNITITNTSFSGELPVDQDDGQLTSIAVWDTNSANGWQGGTLTITASTFAADQPLRLMIGPYSTRANVTGLAGFTVDSASNTVAITPDTFVTGSISPVSAGILLAGDGGQVNVFPGDYTVSESYNTTTGKNDPTVNNPIGLIINKSVTLQGVDDSGVAITDSASTAATITSAIQSNWGTNFFVTAPNVTITGLEFLANGNTSQKYVNKSFEVVADNFFLNHSILGAVDSIPDADSVVMYSSVYLNDQNVDDAFTTSAISAYAILNSDLYGSLVVTNGIGEGLSSSDYAMRITNNRFLVLPGQADDDNGGIYVTGNDDNIAWRNASAALPTEVSGNDFTDASSILFVRGDDTQAQPDDAYVTALLADNTVPSYAYLVDGDGEAVVGAYPYSYYDGDAGANVPAAIASVAVRRAISDVLPSLVAGAGQGVRFHGDFAEKVLVDTDGVFLTGSGADTATLDGGILVTADNVTLTNMTIINGGDTSGSVKINDGSAIRLDGGSGHVLSNLVLTGDGSGRGISSKTNAVGSVALTNVTASGWASGVYFNAGIAATVTNYQGQDGGSISIDGPAGTISIEDSTFADSGIGISDYQSPAGSGDFDFIIRHTTFSGTLDDSASLSIWDTASNGQGGAVGWDGPDIIIEDSEFTANIPLRLQSGWPWSGTGGNNSTAIAALNFVNATNTVTVSADSFLTGSISPVSAAVLLAGAGGSVSVNAGTYDESVTISQGLTLAGAGDSTIFQQGMAIAASDVTINAIAITEPDASLSGYGINVTADISNLVLDDVDVSGFRTGLHVGNNFGVDTLTVSDSAFDANEFGWYLAHDQAALIEDANRVMNVTVRNTSFSANVGKGIYAEKLESALFDQIAVIESGTTHEPWPPGNGVDINLKRGAYADITFTNSTFQDSGEFEADLNQPASGPRENLDGALVIKARDDGSYSAIPATLNNVTVSGNTFISSDAALARVGLRIGEGDADPANAGPSGITITNNQFSGFGIPLHNATAATIVATHNYWGSAASPGSKLVGSITYSPWYVSTTFAANQLSNFVAPSVSEPEPEPDPEPEPTPDPTPEETEAEVEELISNVIIPTDDSGESVSDETVNVIAQAATTTNTLADSIATNIDNTDTNSAIDALASIGKVAQLSGSAAVNTKGTGNAAGSVSTASSGKMALDSFTKVISAIDKKATTSQAALSEVQKTAIQQASVEATASAAKVLSATATKEDKKAVLESIGKIITSNVNLGVSLTDEQAAAIQEATDQETDPNSSIDDQLDTSVPLKPVNKQLISRDVLTDALSGSGITDDEVTTFLEELAQAINPADINIGGVTGEQALGSGFSGSAGGAQTAIEFDAETGTINFVFNPQAQSEQLNSLRQISAVTLPERVIPGRVVSMNVVGSAFPDGIRVRANGAVVITSDRIASVVVPSSHDPINFYADMRQLGKTSVDDQGNITIVGDDLIFSATFTYKGVIDQQAAQARTGFVAPEGGDAADPDHVYSVVYRDGSVQLMQPFVEANAFVDAVRSHGLDITISRNSGIVRIAGLKLRPSYFVDTITPAEKAFWDKHKDDSGLAFRGMDANGDGKRDFQIISETRVQVLYGL